MLHYSPTVQTRNPALWDDVVRFMKQEGMHTCAHEKWNERIMLEYGHPMDVSEKRVTYALKGAAKNLSPLNQLAITTCLEHFTAGLGHVLLGTQLGRQWVKKVREPHRSMWIWHGIEEIEHKNITFDVYKAVGGSWLRRALWMLVVSRVFSLLVTIQIGQIG